MEEKNVAIQVHGVQKSFKQVPVLKGVDFDVARGSIFALLGSNGAGKTTIVRILTTLLKPDDGTTRVNGFDVLSQPARVREAISLTGQFAAVDEILTGRENLIMIAKLRRVKSAGTVADDLLARFGLADAAGRRVSTYSGGMRRRLDIAMSLIGNSRIIFLDEPTTGLDPRSRHTMWQIIRDLASGGVTIFLTTQYLEEADQLAHRVAVLDRGKLVAEGTPEELKRRIPGGHIRLQFTDATVLANAARIFGEVSRDDDALTLQISTDGGVRSLRALLDQLEQEHIEVDALTVHTPDLDDVYFALTGHPVTEKEPAS